MASFDVTSLFTNIPLDETIKIIADQLFSNSNHFEGLSREDFVKFLNLTVKNRHFISNGKFYDQVDGVAMGSPLDLYLLIHVFFFLFMRLISLQSSRFIFWGIIN